MPISLQTNFDVFSNYPIDSRSVVDNTTQRDNIQYKYQGLKVYVKSNQITYVWDGTTWVIDGSNIGGIYGGSGSLPADVGIFLGTVSNTLYSTFSTALSSISRSYKLSKWAESLSTNDSAHIYEFYFRRNPLAPVSDDYRSFAYRIEQLLKPFSGSFIQGPFIDFNGSVPNDLEKVGALVLGVGNGTAPAGVNSLGARMVLSPDNYFAFYTSNTPITSTPTTLTSNEVPITISRVANNPYLSFNFRLVGTQLSDVLNVFQSTKNSYRIKFGESQNEMTFETKLAGNNNPWTESLKILNLNPTTTTEKYSPVKILVDDSGNDWDGLTAKTWNLRSPDDIFRNSENRFTKVQMWGQGSVATPLFVGTILYLKNDGNSFNVILPPGQMVTDIRMSKSSGYRDFPNGTILTIKFTNQDPTNPGYLKLISGTNISSLTTRFYSDVTDALFSGNDESRLTINYQHVADKFGIGLDAGDIMMFRRMDTLWEVVTVNRMRKLITKNSYSGSTTTWQFKTLTYLDGFSTSGRFSNLGTSTVGHLNTTSIGNHPSKFNYSETSIGSPQDGSNLDNYKLKFTVDGNKTVYVHGNFRITLNGINSTPDTNLVTILSNQNMFWEQQGRENILRIGEVVDTNMRPQMASIYSPVIAYGQNDLAFTDPFISISESGNIFFSFKMKINKPSPVLGDYSKLDGTLIDVWVPPFSYVAKFGSYTS